MATKTATKVDVGGTPMTVHVSKPEGGAGPKPAIIVIQEIFGCDPHIQDVTKRFADEGFVSAAPELFHRSGDGIVIPYSETQTAFGERGKLTNDDIVADVGATVDLLKSDPDVDSNNIGIVGFCFGGFVSYYSAAKVPGLKASAVFYGGGILPRPDAPPDAPRVLDQTADSINIPMIGFWGDEDGGIPPANVKEIEETLKSKGKNYESHSYEGAGHGFFCDERGSYNEAAAKDAWSKALAFFNKNLK